jgi:hypothetical protein
VDKTLKAYDVGLPQKSLVFFAVKFCLVFAVIPCIPVKIAKNIYLTGMKGINWINPFTGPFGQDNNLLSLRW